MLIKNLKILVFVLDRASMSNYLIPPPATREGSVSPRPGSSNKSPSNIHGRYSHVEDGVTRELRASL